MTELLKAELQRIGDAAPDVRVLAPDLWRRGRRARLRDRLLTSGAVIAALALLGGAAWVGLGGPHRTPPTDGSSAPGVPDHIYSVPYRALEAREPDLAAGRAAAAYVTDDGHVITVSADDGSYHELFLSRVSEDWQLSKVMQAHGTWVALSPDGRTLAYGWDMPAEGSPVPTGVTLVDLITGQERRVVTLRGGTGIVVEDLTWSPDGEWVAWSGLQTKRWAESNRSYGPAAVGRIRVDGTRDDLVTMRQGRFSSVAIGNDGRVRLVDAKAAAEMPAWVLPLPDAPAAVSDGDQRAAVAPDGRTVLVGSAGPTQVASFLTSDPVGAFEVPLPQQTYPEGVTVRALGWVDSTQAIAEVTRLSDVEPDAGWNLVERQLVLIDTAAPDSPPRVIGEIQAKFVDAPTIQSLTLATDLMTLDRPTVGRPEPNWPWSAERKWAVGGLGAAALLASYLLLRRLARRRVT